MYSVIYPFSQSGENSSVHTNLKGVVVGYLSLLSVLEKGCFLDYPKTHANEVKEERSIAFGLYNKKLIKGNFTL